MDKKYVLAAINIHLYAILSTLLIIGTFSINTLNLKENIGFIIFLASILVTITISYFTKNKVFYNIGVFVTFLLNIILLFNIQNYNYEYNFLENIFNNKYKYNTYNVYVKKTTTAYSNIQKLDGKKVGMLSNNVKNINNHLNRKISFEYKEYDTLDEIISAIENGEIQCFIIEGTLDEYENQNINYKNKVRIIYTSKIKDTI